MAEPLTQLSLLNSTIAYWNDQEQAMDPYFFQGKLTPTYITGKTVTAYFGGTDLPDSLDRRALDTKVNIINTSGFDTDSYTLLDWGKGKTVTEQIRDDIRTVMASPSVDDNARTVIGRKLYTDMSLLFKYDLFTKEQMFWNGAINGKLDVAGDGLAPAHIDFHKPAEQDVKTNVAWGNDDSTPIDDLKSALRFMSTQKNVVLAEAIMNPNTFDKLARSGQIRQAVYPTVSSKTNNTVPIDPDVAKETAVARSGLQALTVYNKANSNGYFIPNDVVLLVPSGPLGRLAYSDAPAVFDFAGNPDVPVSTANNGAALYTYVEPNPGIMNGVLQSRFLPVFDAMPTLMTMRVGDDKTSNRDGGGYTFSTNTDNSSATTQTSSADTSSSKSTGGSNK